MPFKSSDQLTPEAIESELQSLNPQKRINVLFAIRNRILRAIESDESFKAAIFEQRSELARLFREYGSDRHTETAQLFENLINPDDLLQHVPQINHPKKPKESVRQRPFAFHVYGPPLTDEQRANMKKHINSQKRRMGRANQLSLLELLHVLKDTTDNRPIYVTGALDEKLCKQLFIIAKINPELSKRIFILNWNGDTPDPQPLSGNEIYQKLVSKPLKEDDPLNDDRLIEQFGRFIYYRPTVDNMFTGCIRRKTDFGFFVEMLPGLDGLVHKSEVPHDLWDKVVEGNIVTVVVTNIDRDGKIRLSVRVARERIADGDKPLFSETVMKFLTE